ncbi:unnamed protein product [Cuscuta campestris]|uniref:Pentacotripeptide-repeat region of PRORP domain-containing protein n=2 Tax=Cuscuta sect. Cleistogrammica TaxID=1824901 RepID=A0A484MNN8_9ASTE|nr:hypothetical protein DM860_013647 [Cuscuta australis]VFQ90591.1 unnamed protein product [Cuscuta campestris]
MTVAPNLPRLKKVFNPNPNDGRRSQYFLSTLSHVFSKPSAARPAAAVEEEEGADGANPKLSSRKKALAMAQLIKFRPWTKETESSLAAISGPILSEITILHTLRLIKAHRKSLQFFAWAENSGFKLTSQGYFLMLELLGRERNLNSARNFLFSIPDRSKGAVKLEARFFNSLIKHYALAGLFEKSVTLFTTMKLMGVSPSAVTFNTLFSILMKRGRTGMVYQLYDEMLETFGVKPDLHTFNILIKGCCMNSMVSQGFRFFKEMEKHECEPNVITYNTLVNGLCRDGKVKVARNVVDGMLKRGSNLTPNVVTYTTLIKGYCMNRSIDEALSVLKEMVDLGLEPNNITYNTLIHGLIQAQEFDRVKELFKMASEKGGFVPDTCTFNTVINKHCEEGNMKAALEAYEKMSVLKVHPDSATFSILIRCLCEKEDFEAAEKLFDDLFDSEAVLSESGSRPIVAAFNPMFKYLCNNRKTKKADKVFRQLMKRGVQDPCTFKTLIMGHCNEGASGDGQQLLVWMLRRNFVPDHETYESLIHCLLREAKPQLAYNTLEKMLKSSHLPETSIFHDILTELAKQECALECADLVVLMLHKKIRPNITLSTETVRVLLKSGLHGRAFGVLEGLYEKGYLVNIEELVVFLSKRKELSKARELLLYGLKNGQSVGMDICSNLLTALCKEDFRVEEAFELYYELLEREDKVPFECLEVLKLRLEAEGKSTEAEFVAKRMPKQET